MKHRNPALLFFSFDKVRRARFWDTIRNKGLNYQDIALFQCINKGVTYSNVADLVMFLNHYDGDYQALHIIVDILSFNNDSHQAQIDLLRDAIVSYPEVQFLFDRHEKRELDLTSVLFYDEDDVRNEYADFPTEDWTIVKSTLYSSFLEICWESPTGGEALQPFFYRIICGRDNTFDATNLRYAIKYWKYIVLRVNQNRNFSRIQDSRSVSLAICVEEETNQNMFVSYALYKNGYRVFPITSAAELKAINKDILSIEKHSVKNVIILRDYDLQFEDEGKIVDLVRGYKHCSQADIDDYYKSIGDTNRETSYYPRGWTELLSEDPIDENENYFWNNLKDYKTYYITKGPHFSKVIPPLSDKQSRISDDRTKLYITGFQKPVSGLYLPFHKIRAIEERFTATRQTGEFATARNKHDHSTPLDIYDMINRMLKRAEHYYEDGRYRLAALLSGEAIELMNGFHQRLMVKANYINARAENAIAMDIVGGDEEALAADALFRIGMIQDDINRIYLTDEGNEEKDIEDNRGKRTPSHDTRSINVLNRIYNDCRKFCKEHEHFLSEDRFLSAIGHLNEGRSIPALLKDIIDFFPSVFRNLKNSYDEMISYVNDVNNDQQ